MDRLNKKILYCITIYILNAIFLTIAIYFFIPLFKKAKCDQLTAYLLSTSIVFLCILTIAVILFIREKEKFSFSDLKIRFRLKSLSSTDLIWTLSGLIIISILSLLFLKLQNYLSILIFNKSGNFPEFLGFRKIGINEWYLYAFHLIYLFLNIFGEELLWRGYMLPIFEEKFLNKAWAINALFWLVFHVPFLLSVISMLPLIFIIPFIVQKTKNTTTGIIIHAIIGGSGFYSVALNIF